MTETSTTHTLKGSRDCRYNGSRRTRGGFIIPLAFLTQSPEKFARRTAHRNPMKPN